MSILSRLEHWEHEGVITAEQQAQLSSLAREEPFSIFVELNILLYIGILFFVGGLSWTVSRWSQQIGDVVIVVVLSLLLCSSFIYCFRTGPAWSAAKTTSPSLVFDYVLYLGALTCSVELAYIESRFHLFGGQWDPYLLVLACAFFFLAYRFDNRFVLALALSSLAGWFGLTISRWPLQQEAAYRQYSILYSLLVGCAGVALQQRGLKAHFLDTYLNVAANVLFWAVLSGVFLRQGYAGWLCCLVAVCAASLGWGLSHRKFSFVAYAAMYGYMGLSSIVVRNVTGDTIALSYFLITGTAMLIGLVLIARRFGREA